MTGLENILSQIGGNAQKEAEAQLSAAKEKADGILADAKQEAERRAAAIIESGEKQAESIRQRADSAVQLERRNAMLAFKQQVIREALDKTRASLETAPDQEYFQTLSKLAAKFAREGKAVLYLNSRDLARMPADFSDALKKAAPQAEITVSKEPRNIESGFLLVYGGVDVNCTFRAIFEAAEGELRDAAGRLLFPEA